MKRIIEEHVLSKQWGSLKSYDVLIDQKDGSQIMARREIYDSGDGVCVLLYNRKKNTVVLIRQFRLTAYIRDENKEKIYEAPAGLLEGANPQERVIMETYEETGYSIKKADLIYQTFASPGAHSEYLYLYIAEVDENMKVGVGGGLTEEGENIEVHEVDFNQALQMLMQGNINDSKTIILLQYLWINYEKLGLKLN